MDPHFNICFTRIMRESCCSLRPLTARALFPIKYRVLPLAFLWPLSHLSTPGSCVQVSLLIISPLYFNCQGELMFLLLLFLFIEKRFVNHITVPTKQIHFHIFFSFSYPFSLCLSLSPLSFSLLSLYLSFYLSRFLFSFLLHSVSIYPPSPSLSLFPSSPFSLFLSLSLLFSHLRFYLFISRSLSFPSPLSNALFHPVSPHSVYLSSLSQTTNRNHSLPPPPPPPQILNHRPPSL